MAAVAKTSLLHPGSARGTFTAEARVWKGVVPDVNDRAFVWAPETKRGDGLARRGDIVNVHRTHTGETRLTIRGDGRWVMAPLRTADLAPYREVRDGSSLALLAEKLYYHTHKKIAALSAEEEAFLDTRFGWERP